MKINWLQKTEVKPENVNSLLAKEYKFRSRVTRIILEKMVGYEDESIENISFDFDTNDGSFKISPKTPEPIYSNLLKINHLFK